MDLTDEKTRKRTLVETTGADETSLYWRAEDFVAKASMDELIGHEGSTMLRTTIALEQAAS